MECADAMLNVTRSYIDMGTADSAERPAARAQSLHASWLPFSSLTPSFLVRRSVRWQSMGEELIEQMGIMSLSNVWVTPVIALPVSSVPDCREAAPPPKVGRQATYLARLTRWTCPADRLSYSEQFTAAHVNEYQSATVHSPDIF